jgi:hypothetical protein
MAIIGTTEHTCEVITEVRLELIRPGHADINKRINLLLDFFSGSV